MIKHIFMVALSATVLCSSCMDNFLDTESPSKSSSENIFDTPVMTEAALMGVYSSMTASMMYGQKLCVNWQGVSDVEVGSNAFNLDDYNQTNGDTGGMNFYDDPYNTTTTWNDIWTFTEQATMAVDGIRMSPAMETEDRETMQAYLGEALTLRAFFYFDLIKYWGDVPARFEPIQANDVWVPKSDRAVIYDQIIADLEIADEYGAWPGQWSYTTVERANRVFSKALRARIAMSAAGKALVRVNRDFENPYTVGGDPGEINWVFPDEAKRTELWRIVKTECEELLNSGYCNFPTEQSSFKQFWVDIMNDVISTGRESIFEIGFRTGRGRVAHTFGAYHDATDKYVEKKISPNFVASPIYYYRFQQGDVRRDVTLLPTKYVVSDSDLPTGSKEGFQTISSIDKFYFGKFRAEYRDVAANGKLTNSENDEGINFPVKRAADVVLMAAEANCMLGEGDLGYSYLQQVRRRAFGGDGAMDKIPYNTGSQAGMLSAIKDERMFEFAEELIRKQDLIRWGELKEAMDRAKEETAELRECIGDFNVLLNSDGEPRRVYYRLNSDNETLEVHNVDPYEQPAFSPSTTDGYIETRWTDATSDGELTISDEWISKAYYQGDPDKRQLLPIVNLLISSSQYVLVNDYGY